VLGYHETNSVVGQCRRKYRKCAPSRTLLTCRENHFVKFCRMASEIARHHVLGGFCTGEIVRYLCLSAADGSRRTQNLDQKLTTMFSRKRGLSLTMLESLFEHALKFIICC
jgi:hypothetical protein